MPGRCLYVAEWIARPVAEVYEYSRDPAHLALWAQGLGSSIENVDGHWFMDSPGGRIEVSFAAENPYGVLDQQVTSSAGEVVHVPMRVIPDGDGCEIVFTVQRMPGMTDAELARDAGLVAADLATLKGLLESVATPR